MADILAVSSWKDDAQGQSQLTLSEDDTDAEKELKITFNKHLATCTVVEQATDCSPDFNFFSEDMGSSSSRYQPNCKVFGRLIE